MSLRCKSFFCSTGMPCVIALLGGILTSTGATVYSNAFSSGGGSLSGLSIVNESGSSSLSVVAGQLRIDLSNDRSAYVVANTDFFPAPYSTTLKNNPGTVTWAFNVSNQDGSGNNNGFFFCPASSSLDPLVYTSSSYLFFGGAFVGNRMEFNRNGGGLPPLAFFEIPSGDGLGPLPSKGSFRVTYEPSTQLWSVYGEVGSDYVDPTTVSRLLGSAVDSSFSGVPLPYMAMGGQNYGTVFFDNVSITVAPEPSTTVLVVLGIAAGAALRLRQGHIAGMGLIRNSSKRG